MAKKLVPSKSGGASRRTYQTGYSKGMTQKGMGGLGKLKLSTPAPKGPPKERKTNVSRDYAKESNDPMNVSFGDTGYTEEDYS